MPIYFVDDKDFIACEKCSGRRFHERPTYTYKKVKQGGETRVERELIYTDLVCDCCGTVTLLNHPFAQDPNKL